MLRGVVLCSLFGVMGCVNQVPLRDVRMVSGQYVVARFVMLHGFAVMLGSVFMMLGCLQMMSSARVISHCSVSPLVNVKAG